MSRYEVLIVTGSYAARQAEANSWGADLYMEEHANSRLNDREEDSDNYACALVAHNGSAKSFAIAKGYTKRTAKRLGLPNGGAVRVGKYKNGDKNLRDTDMWAVLLEPLFISDRSQASFAASAVGRQTLAELLVETVKEVLPDGGKVALSPGHGDKGAKGYDPGAISVLGDKEAELNAAVVELAAEMLQREGDTLPATAVPQSLTLEQRVARLEAHCGLEVPA